MSRPRILTLCEFYPRDRSDWKGVFIRDYVDGLRTHAEVEVLCSKPRGEAAELLTTQENGVAVTHHVTAPRSSGQMKKLWYLHKWEKEALELCAKMKRPDLIHAHNSVIQGRLAMKLSKAWNIPYVITEHTGPFSSIADHPIKRRRAKEVMENADLVLAVSNRTKDEILDAGISPPALDVLYNPVDVESFKAGLLGPHSSIAFVSRMDTFKGALRTVKAFEALGREDLTLKMVGSGEEYDAVQSYVMQKNLGRQVMLFGTMSKKEIYDVLKRSDLLVFPSLHESFGLVAAEAWATGLPVIIGRNCGAAELVDTHGPLLGEVIDAENVSAITESMRRMLDSDLESGRALRRELIEGSLGIDAFGAALWAKLQSCITNRKTVVL